MRPRIRTLKPEIWQNEAIGNLDPWPRLLFIGLITMADDDGRLRALPNLIAGHCFPYDDVPHKRLRQWLEAVERTGLITLYEVKGTPYAAIDKWSSHQKINRKTDSTLPAPSLNDHGKVTELFRSTA